MACIPAISSMSLGKATIHSLRYKLDQARKNGFSGIELFYDDLEVLAKYHSQSTSDEALLLAAEAVRALCIEKGITVFALQPFRQYEGLKDRQEHERRLKELELWLQIARILGAEYVGVPSTFLPEDETTGDLDVIVADLTKVADMGARGNPPIKFAYESLAWGTHVDVWERCYEIVERVNRPNFGICLDTFNIAARVYADPAAASGRTPNAYADLMASLDRLVKKVDVRKVFYVQVVDAERLSEPLVEGHEFYQEGLPARLSWSRNCRLFYGEEEEGAYLPVKEISRAIFEGLKFEGWVSLELFNRAMDDEDSETPARLAKRAGTSWQKLKRDFVLDSPAKALHEGML